ncbi:UMP kinase [Candidatus Falkowbacteria bacterium]|jgi:uridylate kinase|nr:UMP kinase [Candidatus Falkowbacteria bacterium]MBT7006889.1 UMP kinase [Candidatus Falkowbacteria bacterium]
MKKIVISLGGSLFAKEKMDFAYLKKFKKLILDNSKNYKFYIVTGGGNQCRIYQGYAKKLSKAASDDLDWVGIQVTRLNAMVVKSMFGKLSDKETFLTPQEAAKSKSKIVVGGGWKPGWSTDYVAVYIARLIKADKVINLSNVDYICDKDPNRYSDVKAYEKMSWKELRKLVGNKWTPGLNMPFDPIACKLAEKEKLTVVILNGKKLNNINKFFLGQPFQGTTIK